VRILALTRTTSIGPSSRYRIEQYRPLLRQRGLEVRTLPLFGPLWFRILEIRGRPLRTVAKALYSAARGLVRLVHVLVARWGRADRVLVEHQIFPYLPLAVERWLWPRRKGTLLEFDDAIYLTAGHRAKIEALCGMADAVIVGNRFLEAFARPHARRVFVIPTTVALDRYADALVHQRARRRQREAGPSSVALAGRHADGGSADTESGVETFRICWIGLRYNFSYLEPLAEPLRRLSSETPSCELRVVSSNRPELGRSWDGVRVVGRPWSEAGESRDIADCDVGIMPLTDTEWARGKCALKLLQYMAAGVPVVASPVGVNADLIRHGENGLLASTPEEWETALRSLRDDPALAAGLGEAGRRTVESDYSVEGGAARVAEAYGLASPTADGDGGGDQPSTTAQPR